MDTYEKKYKEAQKWIESIYPNLSHEQQMEAEAFFPELAESEDEKIRKELITHCRNTRCVTGEGAEKIAKWLAWLEKQGESYTKRDVDDAYVEGMAFAKDELDKQSEQKPAEWNEDNNSIISDLLDYFDEDKCLKHEVNDIVKWLKTIKPQQKGWSDNEIKMFDNLITYLDGRKGLLEEIKRTYIDWLKSIKSRVKPKQEWSEEDQNALEDVREAVVHYWGGDSQDILLYWLKSIKQKLKGE